MIPFQILIRLANQLRGSDCGISTPNVRFVPGRHAVGEIFLIPVSEGSRGGSQTKCSARPCGGLALFSTLDFDSADKPLGLRGAPDR